MDERPPLEPPRALLEEWLSLAQNFALDHLDGLASAPAMGPLGAEGRRIAAEVSVPLGEEPLAGGMPAALRLLGRAVEASLTTAGPGYLAFVPGGGLPATALADYLSASFNRFTGLADAAPALARLEGDVLAWLAAEFSFGQAARGLLTSGGSLANFSGIVTAREERLGAGADLRLAVAYTSDQAHHSVAKAARLAGIPATGVRSVPTDECFRMDPAALEALIAQDRAAGRLPFLVVATAGTTNTGAIDPLAEVADACARHGLWLHVDGAYGGAFMLCAAGRQALAGIERADSLVLDPHKGLFLPYGTGCLLVKDGEALRRAHHADAHYLQDFAAAGPGEAIPSATELGPELSRGYRGLRLWLPLMLHGARAFREALAEKLTLAARIQAGIEQLIDDGAALEVVAAPQLSIGAFRLQRSAGEGLAAWNARNAALLAAINGRQRVHLSSTSLPVADGDAFTLRTCVLSFRTHALHADNFLEDLAASLPARPLAR